jgi:hypothetical protein
MNNMAKTKLRPPKRRISKIKEIPLNAEENSRFLNYVGYGQAREFFEEFRFETGLYLRGRFNGKRQTTTPPCGYIFISKDSFDKLHESIIHFDLIGQKPILKICFRKWLKIMPFNIIEWDAMNEEKGHDMRSFQIESKADLQKAIGLALDVRDTFSERFELNIDLNIINKSRELM